MVKSIKVKGIPKKKGEYKILSDRGKYEIRQTYMDNKSRKGLYVYIKDKSSKKKKLYKFKEGESINTYKQYFDRGIVSKRGGVSSKRVKREKRLDKIYKKYPKIDDSISKGISGYTIKDAKALTPANIKSSYINLLRNRDRDGDKMELVRDRELLELLSRPENVDKWKHRIEFNISINDLEGNNFVIIKNKDIKSLSDVKLEVVDKIRIGQDYESQYNIINEIGKRYRVITGNKMKGKVNNISIKLIFRKAR